MAYVEFSSYAPTGFLIVPDGGDSRDDSQTTLIQSDWDHPGIAQTMGWSLRDLQAEDSDENNPCLHESTDGTVTCKDCGLTASDFISAAYDFIRSHEDEEIEALDEYLPEPLD